MEKVNPNVRGTPFGVSFRGGMMFTGFFGDLSQRTKKGKYIHILIHIYIYIVIIRIGMTIDSTL